MRFSTGLIQGLLQQIRRALIGAAAATSMAGFAQELYSIELPASDAPMGMAQATSLEEIVVWAQKRPAAMQQVPLSISVLDENTLSQWAITDMPSAMRLIPNVRMSEAGYFLLPRVRGFGVDQFNKGFEPPAGLAIDGIAYSRMDYFAAALFDLERIEVYRGPQGTTFGKNTTAGVIHLISKNPGDEFEGQASLQHGQWGRQRLELGLGGPLGGRDWGLRLAALRDEQGGYVRNSAVSERSQAPNPLRALEREGLRLKLLGRNVLQGELLLKAEHMRIDVAGSGTEIFAVKPALQQALAQHDPGSDFQRGNYVGTIDAPDFRKTRISTFGAHWNSTQANWELNAELGYSLLDNAAALDSDQTAARAIWGDDGDRSPSLSLELRGLSPVLEGVFGWGPGYSRVLLGSYLQRRDIDGKGSAARFGADLVELVALGELDEASPPPPDLAEYVSPLLGVSAASLELGMQGEPEEAVREFNQQAKTQALFGSLNWQFLPAWSVDLGLRFSQEKKSAQLRQSHSSAPPNPLLTVFNIEEYERQDLHRDESQLAPRIALSYQAQDSFAAFLHWARGFRGGGFNAFSFRDRDEELGFGPEQATDWGLDLKFHWPRSRLNLSLFRLAVRDFQALTRIAPPSGVGLGGTQVENAAKAIAQGFEADLYWQPRAYFRLRAALGFIHSLYKSFPNNSCFLDNPNTDGDEDERCDASGKAFAFTPRWEGSLLGLWTSSLPAIGGKHPRLELGLGADYQSRLIPNLSLDERYAQDAVWRWRASLGLIHWRWSLRIHGENLSDEAVVMYQDQALKGYVFEILEAPRRVFAELRYQF